MQRRGSPSPPYHHPCRPPASTSRPVAPNALWALQVSREVQPCMRAHTGKHANAQVQAHSHSQTHRIRVHAWSPLVSPHAAARPASSPAQTRAKYKVGGAYTWTLYQLTHMHVSTQSAPPVHSHAAAHPASAARQMPARHPAACDPHARSTCARQPHPRHCPRVGPACGRAHLCTSSTGQQRVQVCVYVCGHV